MQNRKIFSLAAFLLTAATYASYAQTWNIPTSVASPNSTFIGATGIATKLSADATNQIQFWTGNPSGQRVTIDAAGSVGIGTGTPTDRLHTIIQLRRTRTS